MTVQQQEIFTTLSKIIQEIAESTTEIRPEMRFVKDLGIDSLSMIEIAVMAQDEFGVELHDDELRNFSTVQDVIDYIQRHDA
jgi:acyl carrier protein